MKKFIVKYKLQLSILGNIIGVVWALYTYFNPKELKSELTTYQKGVFDVLTINQPIDSLQIIFNGQDIKKEKLNIKVFKYKIINTGENDIEPNKFMPEVPFGIKTDKGRIIGIRIVDSNDDYLGKNFAAEIHDSAFVKFNPILFRKGKYITCDLFIIHRENQTPIPSIGGEVANIGELKITSEEEKAKTDWVGNVIAFIQGAIILIVPILILGFLINLVDKLLRNFRKKKFLSLYGYPYHSVTIHQILLADIYSFLRKTSFIKTMNIFLDRDEINKTFLEEKKYYDAVNISNDLIKRKKADTKDHKPVIYESKFIYVIDLLKKKSLLIGEDNTSVEIAGDFLDEVKNTMSKYNPIT
jgi:hypothetical protein